MSGTVNENEMIGVAVKIGTRMVNAMYAMIAIAIIASFTAGVFFATTNERLKNIEGFAIQFGEHLILEEARFDSLELEHATIKEQLRAPDNR